MANATRKKRVWLVALALSAAAVGAGTCLLNPKLIPFGEKPSPKQAAVGAPALVQVETVAVENFPIYINALGLAQASNSVTVKSRVDGQVQTIGFKEGEFVKEGDVLAQLDPAPLRASLDQVTAKLSQDQANLANAERDLERTTKLVTNGTVSRQLFDQQTSNVAQLKALILADQAGIESARVQLAYTTIRSPLNGRVGLRLVDIGNIIHATDQSGIVTIAQIEPVAVIFSVPEARLGDVQDGMRSGALQVVASTADGVKELATGKLSVVDNQVDTSTGTIRLKALFDNAEHRLWPGMSVTVRLLVNTVKNAVAISDKAVQRGPNGPYVYVVTAEGKAEMRPVTIGPIVRSRDLVLNGLQGNERIVTSGHYKVQPNGPVQIVAADAGNPPESAKPKAANAAVQ